MIKSDYFCSENHLNHLIFKYKVSKVETWESTNLLNHETSRLFVQLISYVRFNWNIRKSEYWKTQRICTNCVFLCTCTYMKRSMLKLVPKFSVKILLLYHCNTTSIRSKSIWHFNLCVISEYKLFYIWRLVI